MRPLIYGYMHVPSGASDADVEHAENTMRDYAESEGFTLEGIFLEDDSGSRAALERLVEELVRTEARHVVVPALSHIAQHPMLLNVLLERLQVHAGAQVIALDA